VLDFQLATHEKYIKKFITLFKKLDSDTNGILNEEEFNQLLVMMKAVSGDEEVERLLQVVDPNNNQQITFSECLALLSSVLIYVK
jgi:Ca2+-binding EF-hand superfamily protein